MLSDHPVETRNRCSSSPLEMMLLIDVNDWQLTGTILASSNG